MLRPPRLIGTAGRTGWLAAILVLPATDLAGASFAYSNADWLACFRTVGGANDLVANLGPASRFRNQPWGVRLSAATIPAAAWQNTFPSLDGIAWSVIGVLRGNPGYPDLPLQTLWLTAPVSDRGTAGSALKRQGSYTQGAVASQVEAIGMGAASYGTTQPAGDLNSVTLIAVPSTDFASYSTLVSFDGNLGGTFQGSVEGSTADAFATEQASSVSLLYELVPSAPGATGSEGTLLGWFELTPAGTLTYTAGPPPSRIVSIEHRTDGTVIHFTTVPTVRYRVRSTSSFNAPSSVADWDSDEAWFPGTGGEGTLHVPNGTATRFYAVETAP